MKIWAIGSLPQLFPVDIYQFVWGLRIRCTSVLFNQDYAQSEADPNYSNRHYACFSIENRCAISDWGQMRNFHIGYPHCDRDQIGLFNGCHIRFSFGTWSAFFNRENLHISIGTRLAFPDVPFKSNVRVLISFIIINITAPHIMAIRNKGKTP